METKELLARIRGLGQPDATADPALLRDLGTLTDVPALVEAGRLLAKVPAELLGKLKPLRVAVTGTFTAAAVAPLLRVALLRKGIAPEIHVSGFDQLATDLSDPDSPLASFAPQITLCLLHDDWFVPSAWDDAEAFSTAVRGRYAMFDNLVGAFTERSGSAVLVHTVPLSPVEMRGVVAFDGRAALGRTWRELNSDLLGMALRRPGVHALDLEAYLVDTPARLRDERLYRFASSAWTPEVEAVYAAEAANFCGAFLGLAKKVLVLDLDNTLWGGVVGDDGPSGIQIGPLYPGNAFREMQRRAVQLRKQGVVLALCSKNEATIVDEVLNHHPDLVIRPDDIAARAVNWDPKDHNIRGLAAQLNLGLDSFVFADDSTFETQLVRGSIPEVTVVHLDGDPADHVTALQRNGSFDVLTTTATDRDRTKLYKARAERTEFAGSFSSVRDYLRSLEIQVSVREADEFSLPRLVQLGQRTNQFTMTGASHPESRTREMAASDDHLVLVFEVADRFGAEGIVGGVWVSKHEDHWLIENFVMSCRVFTRGVEHTVTQHIADRAAEAGALRLEADFTATGRNKAAAAFYPDAGFTRVTENRFTLPLVPRPQIGPDWTNLVAFERESADV
ncbi:HAD-superfamily phosphatase, subfamily IIIC/FkbH-like domain-containing protein [Lentzea fradiae]|uniref:HAD-superfamily phosphatase, subfamily IIIC/FkbH-like domain-containing protein n=1 Tax=Lentzea fradiae TaxID=200378 RepID=A0A1G7R7C3_9PSEU|nr:HAD-IIIC family phosphatase [Lentzea fradiae]SDG06604.1 HAD-superfamily phosphatase, subfamily IIIC/FkbH-like domain-containing protein [Lentzea fradiae]